MYFILFFEVILPNSSDLWSAQWLWLCRYIPCVYFLTYNFSWNFWQFMFQELSVYHFRLQFMNFCILCFLLIMLFLIILELYTTLFIHSVILPNLWIYLFVWFLCNHFVGKKCSTFAEIFPNLRVYLLFLFI